MAEMAEMDEMDEMDGMDRMDNVKISEEKATGKASGKASGKVTGKDISFEEAIKRLSQIVDALEDGNAPLDESLALFEEGVRLAGICRDVLAEAEQKVKFLTGKERSGADVGGGVGDSLTGETE